MNREMDIIIDWKHLKTSKLNHYKNINSEDYYEFYIDDYGYCKGDLYSNISLDDVRVYDKDKFEILQNLIKERDKIEKYYNERISKLKETFEKITIYNFQEHIGDLKIDKCY